jgi:hypothetical protein
VRLDSLEIRDFRSVQAATIAFGPGVSVLHGPNELGKSTLVEAIHAALFVPVTSAAGNDYVTWGGSAPACVTLTFEHEGKLWRVSKRFGRRAEAKLESRELDAPHFREVVSGRGVDGRLRELLAWGIAPPGGRGAAPRAESFLLTALLGRQGAVQAILDTSLDGDRDDTGRSLVTRALGALDNDPLVTRILDTLRSRVATVFTANGGLRAAADSPVVQLQQRLRGQKEFLERLQADEVRGGGIRAEVVRLQDDRQRLLGERETAEDSLTAATEQAERARTRATLQNQIDELREQLAQADGWAAELEALESRLTAGTSNLAPLKIAEDAAAAHLTDARVRLQAAAAAVARATEAADQSRRVRDAILAQQRAELEMARTAEAARLNEVTEADDLVAAATQLEQQFTQASEAKRLADAAAAACEQALEQAELHATLEGWLAREAVAVRATEQLSDAQRREQTARDQLDAAAREVADAERRRDTGELQSQELREADAEVLLLQAVESHIAIAKVRAAVRALEEAAERARALRASAQARRSGASDIERSVASRVLPTWEQIAAWRELEQELKTDSSQPPNAQTSPLIPAAVAAVVTLAIVATGMRLGVGGSLTVALLAGFVAAMVTGRLVWAGLQGRVRVQPAELEHKARCRDRWTQEVEPSLRSAGLVKLADYDVALADREGQKVEAQRLRSQADRDDMDAADAERRAASLESRRDERDRLEREQPTADTNAVAERAQAFRDDLDGVRVRLGEVRAAREAIRARLQEAAVAAVNGALEQFRGRQAEYDAVTRELAAAEATLNLAREQCNPEEVTRLRALPAEKVDAPHCTIAEGSIALEGARVRHAEATATANSIKGRLDEAQPRVARIVAALGGDLAIARQQVQQRLDEIEDQLTALESLCITNSTASDLEDAKRLHTEAELQLSSATAASESAASGRSDAEAALATLEREAAALRGQLTAVNRPTLEQRLHEATSNPVFATPDDPQLDLAAAKAAVERLQQQVDRCTNDLNHARGQLHLIAGHVGTERLAQQQETVNLAHAEVLERERSERAALRLLREIESAEADRATHLGRALAGPITEALRALTGGRYGPISLGPDLRAENVEAAGGTRPLAHLSVGTREQLATLLRLAIAGYLQTAIILDDQLVHSDTERLEWFRTCLRDSCRTHNHQVIVFTCRPGDYLRSDGADDAVVPVSLAALVS